MEQESGFTSSLFRALPLVACRLEACQRPSLSTPSIFEQQQQPSSFFPQSPPLQEVHSSSFDVSSQGEKGPNQMKFYAQVVVQFPQWIKLTKKRII